MTLRLRDRAAAWSSGRTDAEDEGVLVEMMLPAAELLPGEGLAGEDGSCGVVAGSVDAMMVVGIASGGENLPRRLCLRPLFGNVQSGIMVTGGPGLLRNWAGSV
jgi:hypothetical protein